MTTIDAPHRIISEHAEKERKKILGLMRANHISKRRLAKTAGKDRSGLSRFLDYGGNPESATFDQLYAAINKIVAEDRDAARRKQLA